MFDRANVCNKLNLFFLMYCHVSDLEHPGNTKHGSHQPPKLHPHPGAGPGCLRSVWPCHETAGQRFQKKRVGTLCAGKYYVLNRPTKQRWRRTLALRNNHQDVDVSWI